MKTSDKETGPEAARINKHSSEKHTVKLPQAALQSTTWHVILYA